jgi:protein-S-isoprenylcysteine O-methyltransferase Ste14
MPGYAYAILMGGWLLWGLPFPLAQRRSRTPKAVQVDRRARWGILLEMAAFSLVWFGDISKRHPGEARIVAAALFFAAGAVLSWGGTRALGNQWRIDAGLSANHNLIRSGPYRVVRHPIYASMLAMLLGTGFLLTPWLRFLAAVALFLAGTEVRVRIEDRLLESRFGAEAAGYRSRVAAYIPFVR